MARSSAPGSPVVTFVGVLLVIVAVGLAVFAFVLDRFERRERAGALTATGTVVMNFPRGPLVRFATAGGDHVDFTADGRWRRFRPGQTVRVYYHPDNPSYAGVDDAIARWRAEAFAAAAALLIGLLGASFLTYRPAPPDAGV